MGVPSTVPPRLTRSSRLVSMVTPFNCDRKPRQIAPLELHLPCAASKGGQHHDQSKTRAVHWVDCKPASPEREGDRARPSELSRQSVTSRQVSDVARQPCAGRDPRTCHVPAHGRYRSYRNYRSHQSFRSATRTVHQGRADPGPWWSPWRRDCQPRCAARANSEPGDGATVRSRVCSTRSRSRTRRRGSQRCDVRCCDPVPLSALRSGDDDRDSSGLMVGCRRAGYGPA